MTESTRATSRPTGPPLGCPGVSSPGATPPVAPRCAGATLLVAEAAARVAVQIVDERGGRDLERQMTGQREAHDARLMNGAPPDSATDAATGP